MTEYSFSILPISTINLNFVIFTAFVVFIIATAATIVLINLIIVITAVIRITAIITLTFVITLTIIITITVFVVKADFNFKLNTLSITSFLVRVYLLKIITSDYLTITFINSDPNLFNSVVLINQINSKHYY